MIIENDMIVECKECGYQNTIFGNEIELELTSVDERGMGEEYGYDAYEERQCQNCGHEITIRISVYEYPIGVLNYNEESVSGGIFTVEPQLNYNLFSIEIYDFDNDDENYAEVIISISKEIKLKKKQLENLSPMEFEDLVKEQFEKKGFEVEKTPQTRDGGKDLIAKVTVSGVPFVVFIECKHHKKKIGVEYIRQLHGVQNIDGVNKAILVTSSSFTKDAIRLAEKKSHLIQLIDGQSIMDDILRED